MATSTLKINKIFKLSSFDLLRTKVKLGNMYMCTDTQVLWYDGGITANDRKVFSYISVRTVNELLYQLTPALGKNYYVWEDNSLWYWNNKWICMYSETTYPSGYVYDDIPTTTSPQGLNPIYRYDMPNMPADDNGLLKDGSVVIRDRNRLIKGKIYIADDNDNMTISSFLGGGLRFLPNGKRDSNGELYIDSELLEDGTVKHYGTLRAEFRTLNNEMYVDYSEQPDIDNNDYPNSAHKYKVFHEGNLDVSAIKIMTPKQIYDKLASKDDELPNVFDFNVALLEGHNSNYFANAVHTHNANDIDGLYNLVQTQAGTATKAIFNGMVGRGITGEYNTAREQLTLSANDFLLSLSGGVTGSATVSALSNTNIEVTVDPSKHAHINYENTMTSLQNQINAISFDINTVYTRDVVDRMIADITPTSTPTSGKPLLVNSNNILPATSAMAKQLDHNITLNLTGPVTGSVTFTGIENTLDIATTLSIESGTISDLVDTKLAARGYVTTIGDGVSTSFTIRHNLGTQNIIVQFRDVTTNEQLNIANTILDDDRLSVQSTNVLANNSTKVYVYRVL